MKLELKDVKKVFGKDYLRVIAGINEGIKNAQLEINDRLATIKDKDFCLNRNHSLIAYVNDAIFSSKYDNFKVLKKKLGYMYEAQLINEQYALVFKNCSNSYVSEQYYKDFKNMELYFIYIDFINEKFWLERK